MARVALLCWEIGGGLGHVAGLLQVAGALKARGWSCIFALPRKSPALRMMPRRLDVRAAPVWGHGMSGGFVRTGSSASMGDMLADLGMRSTDWTRAQIIGWHLVFAEMMPDIVIADHAPGALLAARGRIASAAVGTGYSVPPPGLRHFPPLHDLAPPRDDEDSIVETVNSVLDKFGNPPLANLSDALTGDSAFPCTLPLLDPYRRERTQPVLGPLLAEPVTPRGDEEGSIVCYFQPGRVRQRIRKLADCLHDLPAPCTVFVPGLNAKEREMLARTGAEVSQAAIGESTLAHARLLVHTGGHGMACAAVLAGIPQIVLDYDIEKELTGRALAENGIARRLAFDSATVAEIRDAIVAAACDAAMDAAARKTAAEYAGYMKLDAAERVAEGCDRLAP